MKKLTLFRGLMSILFGLLLLPPVYAAEITLNSRCGLADAILAANSDRAEGGCPAGKGADTITLSRDITLDGELPKITSEITIEGEGYTISGDNRYRIFYNDDGRLTIHDLVMIRGSGENDFGGAIYNGEDGKLSISESSFSDNSALNGGAIFNGEDGELSISESSFIDNSAEDEGGAIFNSWGGEVSISSSTFSDNSADVVGGTIYNWGELVISGSSFIDNSAAGGGAILNGFGELVISGSSFIDNSALFFGGAILNAAGELVIGNSSFIDNSADGPGGAILNEGEVSVSNSTFSNNSAYGDGGAIYNWEDRGELSIINSIIAGSSRGLCYSEGKLKQNINNLIEDGSCSPPLQGDPGLGKLVVPTDGSPSYYPLLAGSRAIDAADDAYCSETDQIGTARPQGAACDIGAYEYVAP